MEGAEWEMLREERPGLVIQLLERVTSILKRAQAAAREREMSREQCQLCRQLVPLYNRSNHAMNTHVESSLVCPFGGCGFEVTDLCSKAFSALAVHMRVGLRATVLSSLHFTHPLRSRGSTAGVLRNC